MECVCNNNLQLFIDIFVFPLMSTCLQHGIVANITWTLGELEVDYLNFDLPFHIVQQQTLIAKKLNEGIDFVLYC